MTMTDYERICSFSNLMQAHRAARKGKRDRRDVIEFEMRLSENLTKLSAALREHRYRMSPYQVFYVYDPKERLIHAPCYRDRVVQHCICDQVLGPLLEKRLIYDNAACRIRKGTHFSLNRLTYFLTDFHKKHGTDGYFLKCDIRKYFQNIDHDVLKKKIARLPTDKETKNLLYGIIDSYESGPGIGLPLGNQTSQWFAIYYLDEIDRLIKEKLHIRYYTRYMDDFVLIHENKAYLSECLSVIHRCLHENLKLELNEKTQIFPIRCGVDYLGFHTYMTKSGKIIRKVRQGTKKKYRRRLRQMQDKYARGQMELEEITAVLNSYHAHLSHGHTWHLQRKLLEDFVLMRESM